MTTSKIWSSVGVDNCWAISQASIFGLKCAVIALILTSEWVTFTAISYLKSDKKFCYFLHCYLGGSEKKIYIHNSNSQYNMQFFHMRWNLYQKNWQHVPCNPHHLWNISEPWNIKHQKLCGTLQVHNITHHSYLAMVKMYLHKL